MGLQVLERERAVFETAPTAQPDLAGNDYILERCLKPEARKDIIALLAELEIKPTAMIDISDGLASEVIHLAKSSGLGAVIYEDKVPMDTITISRAREFNIEPTTCAMNGGEDYELLFTISQADFERVKGHPDLTVIGHMSDDAVGYQLVTRGGQQLKIKAQGWDALLNRD